MNSKPKDLTITDIAKACNVGVSTVSRAINNHPSIDPRTKSKILEEIERVGYIPNNSVRFLKRTNTKTIAIIVKGMKNPFFTTMVSIMEETIKDRNYTTVLYYLEDQEDEVEEALRLEKEKRLKGIIFVGGNFTKAQGKAWKLKVPAVLSTVGREPEKNAQNSFSTISVNDYAESYKIIDYLIGNGHTKIALITDGNGDDIVGKIRLSGYRDALIDRGIEVDESLIISMVLEGDPYSMKNGYTGAKKLLANKVQFTAVYAIADTLAIGACRAFLEEGIKIPEDVSVVGFDGIELGEFYYPSITTLKQPIGEMAEKTVELLFSLIRGKSDPCQLQFEGELIERESSGKAKGHI